MPVAELERRLLAEHPVSKTLSGTWQGDMASLFHLSHPIEKAELERLFQGRDPTGEVSSLGDVDRMVGPDGWLVEFKAPSSVGALWALTSKTVRERLNHEHETAVTQCCEMMERQIRVVQGDASNFSSPLFARVSKEPFASFTPELSTDVYLPNLWIAFNGPARRLSIGVNGLQEMATGLTAKYTELFARALHDHLGLETQADQKGKMEITGVPSFLRRLECAETGSSIRMWDWLKSAEQKKQAQWAEKAKETGWGHSQASALVAHADLRLRHRKAFDEWKLKRMEETKRRVEEANEKPRFSNSWRKHTNTHSY